MTDRSGSVGIFLFADLFCFFLAYVEINFSFAFASLLSAQPATALASGSAAVEGFIRSHSSNHILFCYIILIFSKVILFHQSLKVNAGVLHASFCSFSSSFFFCSSFFFS